MKSDVYQPPMLSIITPFIRSRYAINSDPYPFMPSLLSYQRVSLLLTSFGSVAGYDLGIHAGHDAAPDGLGNLASAEFASIDNIWAQVRNSESSQPSLEEPTTLQSDQCQPDHNQTTRSKRYQRRGNAKYCAPRQELTSPPGAAGQQPQNHNDAVRMRPDQNDAVVRKKRPSRKLIRPAGQVPVPEPNETVCRPIYPNAKNIIPLCALDILATEDPNPEYAGMWALEQCEPCTSDSFTATSSYSLIPLFNNHDREPLLHMCTTGNTLVLHRIRYEGVHPPISTK